MTLSNDNYTFLPYLFSQGVFLVKEPAPVVDVAPVTASVQTAAPDPVSLAEPLAESPAPAASAEQPVAHAVPTITDQRLGWKHISGEVAGRLLVLVSSTGLTPAEADLLEKILGALALTPDQYRAYTTHDGLNLHQLPLADEAADAIILFDVELKSEGNTPALYEWGLVDAKRILRAESLAELLQSVPAKKKLWAALKQL